MKRSFKIILTIVFFITILAIVYYYRVDIHFHYQTRNAIFWSENVEIEITDYEDEVTPNSELDINYFHAFQLVARNVKSAYVVSYFDKSKSWAKDTTEYNYQKERTIQKIRFNLFEAYARKFNRIIDSLRFEKNTKFTDLKLIGDQLFHELDETYLLYLDDDNLDYDYRISKYDAIVKELFEKYPK